MKQFSNQAALFASWRRCAQAGLSPEAMDRLYPLGAEEVQLLCRNHRTEITAFRHVMSGLPLPRDAASFLMDGHGILLEKKCGYGTMEAVPSGFFLRGGMCWDKRCFPRADAA